jgi:RNA polymerase sigma-70 factor (ECF subfamily)
MPHALETARQLQTDTLLEPSHEELKNWMELASRGDAAALEALFRTMYAPLCAVARGFVDTAADAEDVVEETFLKLWVSRERIRVRGSVRNYLTVAVRNTALNHADRRRVEARYTEAALLQDSWLSGVAVNDALKRLHAEDMAEQVRRAIDALPRRARETYRLFYHQNLSYAEIARVMGVSVRTVETQLVRSVRRLVKQLEGVLE